MCAIGKSGEKALAGCSRSNQSPAKVANSRVGAKRDREKKVVSLMISLYCHKKHVGFWKDVRHRMGTSTLCTQCSELDRYARQQIDRCPFMKEKTFCSACKVHCYGQEMRNKIKTVMRFSGPRMMLYHPLLVIKHMIVGLRTRKTHD